MSGVDLREIGGSFAREVRGIDLWTDIDAGTSESIAAAWSEAGVLVFRRQALSEDELVAFSERFGELEIIVRTDWASNVRPEVTHLSNLIDAMGRPVGRQGTGELEWHSDQSYQDRPATGTFLYSVEVPAYGGSTYFANLRLAYDALPDALKRRLEGRRGVFSYRRRVAGYEEEKPLSDEVRRRTPDVTHALVQTHPVSGRKSLYLDPSTVVAIEGVPADESDAVLRQINAHAARPEFVYRHDWQIGDLVMWDNGHTMHRRDGFAPDQRRFLKRTSVRLPPDRHIVPT